MTYLRSIRPKPHLKFVLGEWRAIAGICIGFGASPDEAYRNLASYWQTAMPFGCETTLKSEQK